VGAGEYVRLDRWKGYVPRNEPPNGRAGKKIAYFDHAEFHIVKEAAARINGVSSGQYHYGTGVQADLYGSLVKNPNVRVINWSLPTGVKSSSTPKRGYVQTRG